MSKPCDVTVVIPTYRRPEILARAVESVLSQSYQRTSVVVVDDNTPNSDSRRLTEEVVSRWAGNPRVQYIQHDRNRNGSAARNTGTRAATGRFICYLDDDDEFVPEKLEKQVEFLEQNHQYAAVYCRTSVVRRGVPIYETQYCKSGNLKLDVLMLKSEMYTSSILFRIDAVRVLQGFDETFTRHQDLELLVRFFSGGYHMGHLPLLLLRYHEDSAINRPNLKTLLAVKQHFFRTLAPHLSDLDGRTKHAIQVRHETEVLSVGILSGDRSVVRYFWRMPNLFWHLITEPRLQAKLTARFDLVSRLCAYFRRKRR